ncbi:MAG: GH36-type glycosyl hydrolase domain-containing protein, partial [Phycisphaerae bacterium]
MNLDNGHFSADGREYIITDPHTPRPWHNYLVNRTYVANVTQYGSGASFYQPTGEGLRTNVTEDRDGSGGPRAVYLRDDQSGDYWSLTGWPDCGPMDEWSCRVGLGYQVNRSKLHGIAAEWRLFVPQTDDPCELWTVTVTNESDRRRRISVTPFVEMHLTGGSTLMDFISVLGGHYDAEHRAVFGINSCVKFPPMFKAVLASSAEVAGATVSRDEFLGHYRDYHNPRAVDEGDLHNPQAGTEWLGASLRHELNLAPGESVAFHCVLGVVDEVDSGRDMARKYLAEGAVERHFQDVLAIADQRCSRTVVRTGDEQFDRWMNVWLKHQLAFVARWGRVIGRGFRDILQDTMAHRITEPEVARDCLLEVFSKQFPSGKCIRAWRLPIAMLDLQDYADSPSWMIMALSTYLKETGDFGVLEEQVPFLDPDDPYAEPTESATVWDHVVLAQRYLLNELGSHGLSKIYYGDWCDTMNGVGAKGRGESVMLSMQVKWGCDQLAELAGVRGEESLVTEMSAAAHRLAENINGH